MTNRLAVGENAESFVDPGSFCRILYHKQIGRKLTLCSDESPRFVGGVSPSACSLLYFIYVWPIPDSPGPGKKVPPPDSRALSRFQRMARHSPNILSSLKTFISYGALCDWIIHGFVYLDLGAVDFGSLTAEQLQWYFTTPRRSPSSCVHSLSSFKCLFGLELTWSEIIDLCRLRSHSYVNVKAHGPLHEIWNKKFICRRETARRCKS